jgi:hypothetical protein
MTQEKDDLSPVDLFTRPGIEPETIGIRKSKILPTIQMSESNGKQSGWSEGDCNGDPLQSSAIIADSSRKTIEPVHLQRGWLKGLFDENTNIIPPPSTLSSGFMQFLLAAPTSSTTSATTGPGRIHGGSAIIADNKENNVRGEVVDGAMADFSYSLWSEPSSVVVRSNVQGVGGVGGIGGIGGTGEIDSSLVSYFSACLSGRGEKDDDEEEEEMEMEMEREKTSTPTPTPTPTPTHTPASKARSVKKSARKASLSAPPSTTLSTPTLVFAFHLRFCWRWQQIFQHQTSSYK